MTGYEAATETTLAPAMPDHPRRVALINPAAAYVGPALARLLAGAGHDLVLGDPTPGLVDELHALGAAVEAVFDVGDPLGPEGAERLTMAALERFGCIDSAVSFSGAIVTGRFLTSTATELQAAVDGCLYPPYHFLRAVVPAMVEAEAGQVLVITSASAARPTPGAPLYSAARAGATHLVRNVADEVARHGVQVNAVGTNFMDFPALRAAMGADDPEVRRKVESRVPLGRLGTMDEFAHFCLPYVDGTSRFTTGQFTSYAGGWA